MAVKRVPVATYRIQFTKDFRFGDAHALLPALDRLGITHIYASPVFVARPESTHGYDVIDPTRINPVLGGREEFDRLAAALRERGMGLILDVVPNHMATGPDNLWWMDVLENGASSRFAAFFGINWSLAADEYGSRILIPTLGSLYGEVLDRGELRISYEERGFRCNYWQQKYPIGPATWDQILSLRPEHRPDHPELQLVLEQIARIPPRVARDWESIESRGADVHAAKAKLWALYSDDERVREFIDGNVAALNADRWRLHALLEAQAWRLAWWRMASERINYRRFFDINELVGIRVDDADVFRQTHGLILELLESGQIDGVRVDHIDGLFNPAQYLARLPHAERYVVVEKILSDCEPLPSGWTCDGTSGYDFLGVVNSVLTDAAGCERLAAIWARHTGIALSREDIEHGRKRRVMKDLFPGEMQDLGGALSSLAEMDLYARDLSPAALLDGLIETTACLSVYRTYTASDQVSERDRTYIHRAVAEAAHRNPDPGDPVYDFIARVLTLEFPEWLTDEQRRRWGLFVLRWQQITGPIMAKGVEDSTFYVYNPLVSMNEVGSIGRSLDVEEFHHSMIERRAQWPDAMNGTSTHDTKRSEDVRARIAVLSEIPDEWARHLARWSRWFRDRRGSVDANEEYYLYQNLLGVWPLNAADLPALRERLYGFAVKSAREAREHSSWLHPNEAHEKHLTGFIDTLLGDERFLADFDRIGRKVRFYGAMNALSQVLLKIAAPGLPDFYQGTVGWNLSLVDPDNRRPATVPPEPDADVSPSELLANWADGRIKVHVTGAALNHRRRHHDLFRRGEYIPVRAEGRFADRVIAFLRRLEDDWALIVVPRLTATLSVELRPPVGQRIWRDTRLVLPAGTPLRWSGVLAEAEVTASEDGTLPLARALERLPVALLSARA